MHKSERVKKIVCRFSSLSNTDIGPLLIFVFANEGIQACIREERVAEPIFDMVNTDKWSLLPAAKRVSIKMEEQITNAAYACKNISRFFFSFLCALFYRF